MKFCGAKLALVLGLALLTSAQLREEPAGCPKGYVHLTGGQCVQLSMANKYLGDSDQLDPRSTGFRPVRRRGGHWPGAWGGPVLAASSPEARRVPAPRVELEQRADTVEVARRPADGQRRRGQRRGQHGRRGGRRQGGRGAMRPRRPTDGTETAPSPLMAAEGGDVAPTEPTCASGQVDGRGRCRDDRSRETSGRRRGRVGRRGRNRAGHRRRRPRQCKRGFIRLSKGQCIPDTGFSQEVDATESSTTVSALQPDSPQTNDLSDGDGLGETTELAVTDSTPPRRRQGQRRRGPRERHGGRRRRPGRRQDSGQTNIGQPDSGKAGSGDIGQTDGGQADSGSRRRPSGRGRGGADRRAGDRPPCPPGHVRWRRGRCVSADRLQACPEGSQRRPGGRCVRCGVLPPLEDGRCPDGCARTADKCACCQPGRRQNSDN